MVTTPSAIPSLSLSTAAVVKIIGELAVPCASIRAVRVITSAPGSFLEESDLGSPRTIVPGSISRTPFVTNVILSRTYSFALDNVTVPPAQSIVV